MTLLWGCALVFSACNKNIPKKKTDWKPEYAQLKKTPNSLFLFYNSLGMLFPDAAVEHLHRSYRMRNLGFRLRANAGTSLVMLVGNNASFEDGEADSLLTYVANGETIFISANKFDEKLLKKLGVDTKENYVLGNFLKQKISVRGANDHPKLYEAKMKMESLNGAFEKQEIPDIPFVALGNNENNAPDFIVYFIGKGKLFLHAAPAAFTNYFLLQNNNNAYPAQVLGYIGEPVKHLYFLSFNNRETQASDLGVLWVHPATRLALLLALALLVVFLLFEMKRRQKIIPVIKPIQNDSVAFAETIGRLYYNKKKHENLAVKMIQHFMEYVRSNYYLNTNDLNNDFVHLLAAKSGRSEDETQNLVAAIKEINNGAPVSEKALEALYIQIQLFYNGRK
ncbi:MAG: hypothetical protein QM642_09530 [Edaphocola sp.]